MDSFTASSCITSFQVEVGIFAPKTTTMGLLENILSVFPAMKLDGEYDMGMDGNMTADLLRFQRVQLFEFFRTESRN